MLLKDFYKVGKTEKIAEGKYKISVHLNNHHEIFKGHFPGNPVMPGVCMIQVIKELTQEITGFSLMLKTSSTIKFMALINPDVTPDLVLDLDIALAEDDTVKVKNMTTFGGTVALKLSSVYKKL